LPRYFLHIRNPDGRTEDLEGEILLDLDLAVEAAVDSARELLIDRLKQHQRADGQGSQVEITDEEGTVLAVVDLGDIATGKR
jgi:hypothetical protein